MDEPTHSNTIAGWREWVSLPEVGVPWIKAKLDTGARSSAIHAFDICEFDRDGVPHVRFGIHPWQKSDEDIVEVVTPMLGRREVRSSSGHVEDRIVVPMVIKLFRRRLTAEMTLANRDQMGFRLLVGREALAQGFLVDANTSYLGRRPRLATRRRNRGVA